MAPFLQTERALKMLEEREQVAVENEQLLEALRNVQVGPNTFWFQGMSSF